MTNFCPRCFGDKGLKKRLEEVRPQFPSSEKCDFHPNYKAIPAATVAEIVDDVFRTNYEFAGYGYNNEQFGDPLEYCVGDLVEAENEQIAAALVHELIEQDDYWPPDGGEPFYDDTQNYERANRQLGSFHSRLWTDFCESIVHNERFFNSRAKALILEMFEGVHNQTNSKGKRVVYRIDPGENGSKFFRARIGHDYSHCKEISQNLSAQLGPPPKRNRSAGRMNPAGVVCFYGAFDVDTCVAELRPRVGAKIISAQFEITRPIYVLDTTRFEAPMKTSSLFLKNYIERVMQWDFMSVFRQEIAKPISPDDEFLDYIPTQAVAEYFLNHHKIGSRESAPRIEAIIFRSAQNSTGKNIAILGDAALVVSEEIRSEKKSKSSTSSNISSSVFENLAEMFKSETNPSIRVVPNSGEIRKVTYAQFGTEEVIDIDNLPF